MMVIPTDCFRVGNNSRRSVLHVSRAFTEFSFLKDRLHQFFLNDEFFKNP